MVNTCRDTAHQKLAFVIWHLTFDFMKLLNKGSTEDPGFVSQLTCILI